METAARTDHARLTVHGGDPADREAIALVGVGQGKGEPPYARQGRDVAQLFERPVAFAPQRLDRIGARISDRRHDLPGGVRTVHPAN